VVPFVNLYRGLTIISSVNGVVLNMFVGPAFGTVSFNLMRDVVRLTASGATVAPFRTMSVTISTAVKAPVGILLVTKWPFRLIRP
jgi:hypothetical protein